MNKLAPRGRRVATTTLALSIALLMALVVPAAGFAAEDPLLSFSPVPVGFAKTTVGAQSQTQAVDVYNGSASAVAVDGTGIEGADAGDFQLGGGNCGWVEPDQHCSISVTFAPGSAGTKAATLSVKLNEAPEQTVQLEAEAVAAQLAFTPSSHDFGIQRVNRGDGSANFQLANLGEAPTQLGGIGIGGPDTNNFWTNGGDCWGGRWLAPGESCNVQVGFNPWDTIAYEAQLQANAYGSTFTASLAGFGGRPAVEVDANPVEFGSVPVGSAGPVEAIVLTNEGNIATSFFIAVIAGGSVGSFQLIDEDCTAVALEPGASCTAYVRFVPLVTGPKAARLALFGEDEGGTMVMLSGEGTAPAGPAPASASTALSPSAAPLPNALRRGKQRRFERGAGLVAGRARCHAVKCRKALRARRVVG